jgi:hypothetical protein
MRCVLTSLFSPGPNRWSLLAVAAALTLPLAACSDTAAGPGETVGESSSALFANDRAAYDYFVSKGLTSFQSAGIVGNLDQESGVSPTAVQGGGPGRGTAQWSVGGRWDTDNGDNAVAYASQHGQSVWSLQLQLDFIWYELTTFSGYGLAALRASTNVSDATIAFETRFEGCGQCAESTRISYAKAVLAAYGTAPPYAAAFVSQSFPAASTALTMAEGELIPSYIELKNVGTKTWDSKTRLATTQARDRSSVFADSTWISKSRPAEVTGTVPPGATYRFKFDLAAPATAGTYSEFFGVVEEGVAWFSDPGQGGPPDNDLEVKIQVVTPDYRGAFKGQSFPRSPAALTVHQGDVAKGYIELTNTGAQAWKAGTTKLAPIPRDKPSPFADASWLSPTRVSTLAANVAPGAVGRFEVALDAHAVGDTEIAFGLVEESVAWFADTPGGGPADGFLKVHLVVVPQGAPLDAGAPAGGDAGSGGAPSSGDGGAPANDGFSGGVSGSASCSIGPSRRDEAPWTRALGVMLVLSGVGALARRRKRVRAA